MDEAAQRSASQVVAVAFATSLREPGRGLSASGARSLQCCFRFGLVGAISRVSGALGRGFERSIVLIAAQEELIRAIETALSSNTVPADTMQILLNLAEFMEVRRAFVLYCRSVQANRTRSTTTRSSLSLYALSALTQCDVTLTLKRCTTKSSRGSRTYSQRCALLFALHAPGQNARTDTGVAG